MSDTHPAASDHIPFFLPGADGSDPLFIAVTVILTIVIVSVGALYFRIHSLPEHIGEKHNSTQLQLISVLVLLALFTHNNSFWVLALLIAVVRVPDFLTPLEKIAASLGKLAVDIKENEPSQPSPTPKSGGPAAEAASLSTQVESKEK